ncbi:MAG: thioredoxin domain-containing protein [Phycisphaerales bacterium]|jgi:protein-disulfide isomerase/uncharacterized membrane protein|nr:thioredoxin domain-containing protein [Phycisphaerales bacterium]
MNKTEQTPQTNPILFYVGALLLLVSLAASFMLAGTKLGIFTTLPGCGVGSGCDAVTKGPWGTVPVIGWPVSFVGVSWFATIFVLWVRGCSRHVLFLWAVRIGVLASLGFFLVMLMIGHFCKWCALAHVCNILFWVVAECVGRQFGKEKGCSCNILLPFFVVFVFVSVVMGATQFFISSHQDRLDEEAGKINVEDVIRGEQKESTLKLLDATHRIGPDDAPVKIVVFTDYQCPDCKNRERELSAVVAQRDDVSLSVKHFPMCAACNVYMNGRTMHANACWAARAAETADILRGNEGWEQMHKWLFENRGSFTDKTFPTDLAAMGYDPKTFLSIMTSDETLIRVQKNIDDAKALGIKFTPMIFINGVEYLWYYGGKQESVASLVDRAAEYIKNGGEVVAPPSAQEKLVEDWRRGKILKSRGNENLCWTGDGQVEFVVWGDYQSPYTRDLDVEVQKLLLEDPSKIKYSFRQFPMEDLCNTSVANASKKSPGSCYLSELVEAVEILSGPDARWELHNWIISQTSPIDLNAAESKALKLAGVDLSVLKSVASGSDVGGRIQRDILAKNRVWRRSIPVITIDNRLLPWWDSDVLTPLDLFHLILDVVEEEGSEENKR